MIKMSGLIFKLIFLLFLIILFTQTIKTFLISDLEGNSNKRLNIDNETNLKVDKNVTSYFNLVRLCSCGWEPLVWIS